MNDLWLKVFDQNQDGKVDIADIEKLLLNNKLENIEKFLKKSEEQLKSQEN
jgi:hypothetical protein